MNPVKSKYFNTYLDKAKEGDDHFRNGHYFKYLKNRTYLYFFPLIWFFKLRKKQEME